MDGETSVRKRIPAIDIARGFAIIFIVFGHTAAYSGHLGAFVKFVAGFHVVLFFILSGYLFSVKENEKFSTFLKNKFCRIMVPYFVWSVAFLIPYMILGKATADALGVNASFDIGRNLAEIAYGVGADGKLKQNTSLWFLPALFSMNIVFFGLIKLVKRYIGGARSREKKSCLRSRFLFWPSRT